MVTVLQFTSLTLYLVKASTHRRIWKESERIFPKLSDFLQTQSKFLSCYSLKVKFTEQLNMFGCKDTKVIQSFS
jgi:hypothetical protein